MKILLHENFQIYGMRRFLLPLRGYHDGGQQGPGEGRAYLNQVPRISGENTFKATPTYL